jgi:RND family efflux transporter MFP subunit
MKKQIIIPMLLAFVTACSGGDVKDPELVRPAKLHVVKASSDRFDTSFPAIIEAGKSSLLTFQVGGLLEVLSVREGQRVQKGAVIGRLNQRRYRNAVDIAQAQYRAAHSEYLSAARLLKEDAIARIVVDQRRAQSDVAQAQLDSARKDLTDTILRAPFSGIVAEKHAEQFQNVQPKEDIVTLQSIGTVEASVSVPASLIPQLANEGAASSSPHVILNSAPSLKIPGTFRSATTQGDTQSQTFQVKFAFSPPPGMVVLPGMTGTVYESRAKLEGDANASKITVPLGAIMSDGNERYVWVVNKKTMKVKKRVVKVDTDVGEEVALLAGLKPGETIVAAGAAYLHEGTKIRPYKP